MRVNPKAVFWGLNKTLSAAANSASGANASQIQNQYAGDLFIRRVRAFAYFSSAQSSGIAGTPLLQVPSPTVGSNTLGSTAYITMNLKIGNNTLWQQDISLLALMGSQGQPFEFDVVLPKIAAKQDIQWSVGNATAFAITAELELDCLGVPTGEKPFLD